MYQEVTRVIENPLVISCGDMVAAEAKAQIDLLPRRVDSSRQVISISEQTRRTEMIWGKIIHTGDAVIAAGDIASRDPSIDPVLAVTLATLHDIGRFEQISVYGDYSDLRTGYSHAHKGADKLVPVGIPLRKSGYDPEIMIDAVYWHSDIRYSGNNDAARLLRDIDKLALMRRHDDLIRGIYRNGHLIEGPPSDSVLKYYAQKQLVPNSIVKTTGDAVIRMCAWQFDINYEVTLQIITEEQLLKRMIDLGEITDWGRTVSS